MADVRERNRADAIAKVREEMLGLMATLDGEFDSRIKDLNAARRAYEEAEGAANTKAQADELLASAKRYDAEVKKRAEEGIVKLGMMSAELDDRENKVRASLNDLEKREASLRESAAEFKSDVKESAEQMATKQRELEERERDLSKRSAVLADAEAENQRLRGILNERLEGLRIA